MTACARILLIDLAPDLISDIRQVLRDSLRGVSVGTARNAHEAEVLLHVREYDGAVIAVGTEMPDAVRLIDAIRGEGIPIPVILVVPPSVRLPIGSLSSADCTVCVHAMDAPRDQIAATVERALRSHRAIRPGSRLELRRRQGDQVDMVKVTAGTLYHEVSNPIMTILGMSELLLSEETDLDDEARSKIQAIRTSADRIQTTLTRLMNLRRTQLRDTAAGHIIDHKSCPIDTDCGD